MVLDSGDPGPGSPKELVLAGMRLVAEAHRGYVEDESGSPRYGGEVVLRRLESRLTGRDRDQLVGFLAGQGCDLVVAIGGAYADAARKAAAERPDASFVVIDGSPIPDAPPNLACVGFAEHEAAFLAGSLAGSLAADRPKSKAGFVGGIESPQTRRCDAGFWAGAAYANPSLRAPGMILRQYCGAEASALDDPEIGAVIGAAQYKAGALVVYCDAGRSGAGLYRAARSAGRYAIASGPAPGGPEAVVAAVEKRYDRALVLACDEYLAAGKIRGGYRRLGLAEDGLRLSLSARHARLLEPREALLSDIKARIVSGEIRVPEDERSRAEFVKSLR